MQHPLKQQRTTVVRRAKTRLLTWGGLAGDGAREPQPKRTRGGESSTLVFACDGVKRDPELRAWAAGGGRGRGTPRDMQNRAARQHLLCKSITPFK